MYAVFGSSLLLWRMTYAYYAQTLSAARMSRYRYACAGNERKAMTLYRLNVRLSQDFFGVLSVWEITFRNAIDEHYKKQTQQPNWLQKAAQPTGMFASAGRTCRLINEAITKLGHRYTHDRLVAELSFGFWVQLFNGLLFSSGGKTLHLTFGQRPAGSSQQFLFQELNKLRLFRNRLAHHEPICFNLTHQKSATYVSQNYRLLLNLTNWLGHRPPKLFFGLDHLPGFILRLTAL